MSVFMWCIFFCLSLLMDSFYEKTRSLHRTISWIVEFMKALSPAYFMTVAASSGALSAAVFYEGVLLLVWLVEWLLLTLILPGANLYVLLCMVNHLSKEDMLSKMAELLETMINWSLKTMLGAVLGLQAYEGWLRLPWMPSNELPGQNCRSDSGCGKCRKCGNRIDSGRGTACKKLSWSNGGGGSASCRSRTCDSLWSPILSFRSLVQWHSCIRQTNRRLPWHNGRRLCPASADHADCGNSVCAYLYSSHGVCRRIKVTVSGNEP